MTPAIIISAHTMGLSVIRALGQAGIPIIALTYQQFDMGQVSKYVRHFFRCPHPEKESHSFLDMLIALGKQYINGVLIPADDASIVAVSQNKSLLQKYFSVASPDWNTTEKFIVKKYTYEIAEDIGVPYPHTLFPEYMEEVKIFSLIITYPCIIKPYESHKYFDYYKRKMTIVNTPAELMFHTEDALINNFRVMLQELIPGDDTQGINFNCLRLNGKIRQQFFARKVRLTQNGFGVPVVVKSSEKIPGIYDYTENILNRMNFSGFACTEFKFDSRDNQYKLMEVNGRHNRSGLLALKSGINFPLLEYNYLVKNIISPPADYKYNIYWIDEFRDIETAARRIFLERYNFIRFIKPYLYKHIFAVFSISDIAPFLKRVKDAFHLLIIKVHNKLEEKNVNRKFSRI